MTEFTTWRSLVDGEEIIAIPDLGLDHFYFSKELETVDPWPDEDGDLDASAVGEPSLNSDGINGNQTVQYGDEIDRHETGVFELNDEQEFTAVAVVELDKTSDVHRFAHRIGDGGFRWGVQEDTYDVNLFGGSSDDEVATADTDPHVHVLTYNDGNIIWDVDGDNILNDAFDPADDPTEGFAIFGQDGFDEGSLSGNAGCYGHESSPADAERRNDITETLGDAFGIDVNID